MEYLLKFNGATNRWESAPPGYWLAFDGARNRFVDSDGREVIFRGDINAFERSDGAEIRFVGEENMFATDDRSVTAWFDGAINAFRVTDGADPRFRVTVSTSGSGTVTGAGWYAENAPVTVAATPAANWELSSLVVDGSPVSSPHTFTMPPRAVTAAAVFTQTLYSVTIRITSASLQGAIDNSAGNIIVIDGTPYTFDGDEYEYAAPAGVYEYEIYLRGILSETGNFTIGGV